MSDASRTPDAGLSCLHALGTAYRGDWSDFDGRTLRSQLDEVSRIIRKESQGEDVRREVGGFYFGNGICNRCHSWMQNCSCGGAS
jgi:hypothetical protein